MMSMLLPKLAESGKEKEGYCIATEPSVNLPPSGATFNGGNWSSIWFGRSTQGDRPCCFLTTHTQEDTDADTEAVVAGGTDTDTDTIDVPRTHTRTQK